VPEGIRAAIARPLSAHKNEATLRPEFNIHMLPRPFGDPYLTLQRNSCFFC
jgi:hypothetical protein